MQTTEPIAASETGAETERRELDWLLTSGVLGRSGNLNRVLKYICEERFAGRASQIKEYSIATEALGRRPDFDPNSDTIVRVTFHSLRKRLLDVYQNEGANRPVRLVIPPGHYDPSFVPAPLQTTQPPFAAEPDAADHDGERGLAAPAELPPLRRVESAREIWLRRIGVVAVVLVVAGLAGLAVHHRQASRLRPAESVAATGLPPAPQGSIRALMGAGRKPYIDHSGVTWATGNYCQGGTNVNLPPQRIEGTEDAPLYLGGVRGIAHCIFPVTQKLYELHFYFAETSDLQAATRLATLSVNAGPAVGVDVVDDAGGNGIATSTVVAGVAPENDGAIHVDLTSEVSLLDAVELLPAPSVNLLPVRLVTGLKPFVDGDHQLWSSDRYFSGGRRGLPPDSTKQSMLGLYESDRIGRFRYTIPAVPFARYRVKLYFREPWFGKENGGAGGVGSRVFDVACNNQMLLKNFDILATSGSAPVVKTFENIQASAGGRIELSFMPVVNYAVVNAIEIVPEDQ